MTKSHHSLSKPNHQKKLLFKIGFILFLVGLLMIPNAMIQNLIQERNAYLFQVQEEVSQSWGGIQTIGGPVLAIPYTQRSTNAEGHMLILENTFFVLPQDIKYNGNLETTLKKRSLYEVLLYSSDLHITAQFNIPELGKGINNLEKILYDKATLTLTVSDPKAIKEIVHVSYKDNNLKLSSGSAFRNIIGNGLSTSFPLEKSDNSISLDINLSLNGHQALYFYPSGESTSIALSGNWGSPSFQGNVLPSSSEINEQNFSAQWLTNEYNRPTPSVWTNNQYSLIREHSGFGVKLIKTADQYQQNSRTAKYALLIIALTFGLFFVFETVYKSSIHPIQYLLLGFSLSLFYYLLLSIAEHLGFTLAYGIASYATISSICIYAYYILKDGRKIGILSTLLVVLYSYIFILLQLEDFALLAGSVGLFIILGLAMFITRNVDWYNTHANSEEQDELNYSEKTSM
jgi:inner membrane protein